MFTAYGYRYYHGMSFGPVYPKSRQRTFTIDRRHPYFNYAVRRYRARRSQSPRYVPFYPGRFDRND